MSAPLQIDEALVRSVVEEVVRTFGRAAPAAPVARTAAPAIATSSSSRRFGLFPDAPSACAAAQAAFEQLRLKGVEGRAKVVEIVKTLVTRNAEAWGKFEFEETKIGRLAHKIEKLQIVKLVPGV